MVFLESPATERSEATLLQPGSEHGFIKAGNIINCSDTCGMFCGVALAKVLELADYNVFRWGDRELQIIGPSDSAAQRHRPRVQWVHAGKIDVGFVSAFMMDDIEVPSL